MQYTLHGECGGCGHTKVFHEPKNEPYGSRPRNCRYVVSQSYGRRQLCPCYRYWCGCPSCTRA